jgi:hypothetical protein
MAELRADRAVQFDRVREVERRGEFARFPGTGPVPNQLRKTQIVGLNPGPTGGLPRIAGRNSLMTRESCGSFT